MPATPAAAPRPRLAALLAALLLAALLAPAAAVAAPGGEMLAREPLAVDDAGAGLPDATAELMVEALAVPSDFQESVVFSGLTNPMAIQFAPDGRVFVAEKSGRIQVFGDLTDQTPTTYADLSTNVHDFWDRGLLGMALDPGFTTGRPYVYVTYTYNKDPNSSQFPRWPDSCPNPPGATADGCVVTGRLSRLDPQGQEEVLIEDFCQQYPSHSLGALAFAPDGSLYLSAGDGASFDFADYGQDGDPVNPCGDPPGGVGGSMTVPTAEGGALRSQDIRTPDDPTTLDGALLRVDPDTGAAAAGNPNADSADPNARRIVAHGFRNPFRLTLRPGTDEVWLGDVGWTDWEEVNRVPDPKSSLRNYGWPCYEGANAMFRFDNLDLNLCESLYSQGDSAHVAPVYAYHHNDKISSSDGCPAGGSSISGLAFTEGGTFPSRYDGALFFADYSRKCISVMLAGSDGLPDPGRIEPFLSGSGGPVDLRFGPDGDLYYADFDGGAIRRIRSLSGNRAPIADASASPTSGPAPLTVAFDGTGSSDPDGNPLTYAWDLDGDGAYDDSTSATPSFTYETTGSYTATLRVTDTSGAQGTDSVTITVGNPPEATIDTPDASLTWSAGETIAFSGHATSDGEPLPASALDWEVNLEHCEDIGGTCHTHALQSFDGVASGSFVAPGHEYPAHLEITLIATGQGGLEDRETLRLDPKTVEVRMESDPSGLGLTAGSTTAATPFTKTLIQGSTTDIAAPSPQTLNGSSYEFESWSDGGAASHTITAPEQNTTYRATFTEGAPPPSGLVAAYGFDEGTGTSVGDASGQSNTGTVSGATWTTAGKNGGALSFDGVDDSVMVPDADSLDLTTGMTLESWVRPTALGSSWRTAIMKEAPGDLVYALYASGNARTPSGHVNTDTDRWVEAPSALATDTWAHIATTWDGETLRLFVDGTQVASRAIAGTLKTSGDPLRIGGNAVWPEWFEGQIDDVRVYNRALSASELQADMTTPVGGAPEPSPRLAVSPASLAFTAQEGGAAPAGQTLSVTNAGSGTLDFTATDDQPWISVTPAGGTAPLDLTVTVDPAGLAAGTHTGTVTVESAGALDSPQEIDVTLTVEAEPAPATLAVTPESMTFTATAGGANPPSQDLQVSNSGGGTLSATVSDDAAWLTLTPTSGTAPFTVGVSADTGSLAEGTYSATITVEAAGAEGSPKLVPVTFTVSASQPPPTGLVAAYAFDETSGTTATDGSGTGNSGTISGATRTTAGHSGGALSFDGVDDWVTVADAPSLDLSTGMTLEAWVNPSALGTIWRTVVIKEQPGNLVYALYANTDTTHPSGHVYIDGDRDTRGTATLPVDAWTHLAATYDGTTLRLFVDGAEVSTRTVGGAMPGSSDPLRIGGNAVWPEWFAGRIDDVRVYDRALSAAEIQSDMGTPVSTTTTTTATATALAVGAEADTEPGPARRLRAQDRARALAAAPDRRVLDALARAPRHRTR